MIVNRDIYINPVEPEFVAFRISSGTPTKVDFHFKRQSGAPYNVDVVAQLQMTSRSRDLTEYLSCPAIDVVNGVARATIPAGLSYDPNGWRLRLTGTVDQEARVIAYGVATAIAGAGPQVEAQDVIDTIDLNIFYGMPCTFTVKLWQDEGKYVPYDLTATTLTADVYSAKGGTVLTSFAIVETTVNTATLTLTQVQVDALPPSCWWALMVASNVGLTTLAEGRITVNTP